MTVTIDLTDRVAWVTGGAAGIGAAVLSLFERAGAKVVSLDCVYRTDCVKAEGRFIQVPLDVADSAAVNATVADLLARGYAPDVLVNNAVADRGTLVWNLSDEDWQTAIDVNMSGAFRMTRACCGAMRDRGGGAIINIASIDGLRGRPGEANYAASKGGLMAFTRAVATELGPHRIRVNAVAPGVIDTPARGLVTPEQRARAMADTVLLQLGKPEDVAGAVLFLASPLANHITGHVLVVDGGQLL